MARSARPRSRDTSSDDARRRAGGLAGRIEDRVPSRIGTARTDIYVIGADGTGEARLTNTPEDESQPAWSADGKELRFTVFANDASRIYSIDPTGKNRKLLGTVPGRALRISPDGKTVLYWTGTWTAMRLFASRLDGSDARQLTDGSGVVWGARWSPDGKRLAFGSKDEQGALHVFLTNADGSARRQVTRLHAPANNSRCPPGPPTPHSSPFRGRSRPARPHLDRGRRDRRRPQALRRTTRPTTTRCPPGSPTASASPTRAPGAAAWKSGS